MAYAAFNLYQAVQQKLHQCVLHMARFKLTIPADTTIEAEIKIPINQVWFMVLDHHGDILYNKIKHGCIKDGFTAFEPTLIGADNLEIPYAIPFICEDYLIGTLINTDTTQSHEFELTIFFADVPKDYFAKLKEEVGYDEEVKGLVMERWKTLSPAEKMAVVDKWMGLEVPVPPMPVIALRR